MPWPIIACPPGMPIRTSTSSPTIAGSVPIRSRPCWPGSMRGCPEGDKKDLPAPKEFADGWVIGKPDIIFELPAEQKVQAEGVVDYQYFVTKTNFKEDVWVQAAEARPGNRAVVHHIIVFFRDPKAPRREQGGDIGQNMIVGTAPGDMPQIFKPGTARKIPAGAELVWQMHYTPTGKPETDRSQVGFIFYKGKEPPAHAALTKGAGFGHRFGFARRRTASMESGRRQPRCSLGSRIR